MEGPPASQAGVPEGYRVRERRADQDGPPHAQRTAARGHFLRGFREPKVDVVSMAGAGVQGGRIEGLHQMRPDDDPRGR